MGGEQIAKTKPQGFAETHMAHVFGVYRIQVGAVAVTDLDQRTGQAGRVTGELYRGGVGQQLSLPGNGGLDQPTEKQAQIAHHYQSQRHQYQAVALAVGGAATGGAAQHEFADLAHCQNARKHGDQSQIQAHVSVKNMTEFMGDHALEFVPVQFFQSAMGDHQHGFRGAEAGHKGVNRLFLVQNIKLRGGDAGGDTHFLHHIDQFLFVAVPGIRINRASAEHGSKSLASPPQLPGLEQAATHHHQQGEEGDPERQRVTKPLAGGDQLYVHPHEG